MGAAQATRVDGAVLSMLHPPVALLGKQLPGSVSPLQNSPKEQPHKAAAAATTAATASEPKAGLPQGEWPAAVVQSGM